MRKFLKELGLQRLVASELLVPGYLVAVAVSVAETTRSAAGAGLVAMACLIAAFVYLIGPQLMLAETPGAPVLARADRS